MIWCACRARWAAEEITLLHSSLVDPGIWTRKTTKRTCHSVDIYQKDRRSTRRGTRQEIWVGRWESCPVRYQLKTSTPILLSYLSASSDPLGHPVIYHRSPTLSHDDNLDRERISDTRSPILVDRPMLDRLLRIRYIQSLLATRRDSHP